MLGYDSPPPFDNDDPGAESSKYRVDMQQYIDNCGGNTEQIEFPGYDQGYPPVSGDNPLSLGNNQAYNPAYVEFDPCAGYVEFGESSVDDDPFSRFLSEM
jgi:hypothetical protein